MSGIVTRANLLQVVAGLTREIPDPTTDDDHIRDRIITSLEKSAWCPFGLSVIVRGGIVHLKLPTIGHDRLPLLRRKMSPA